MNFVPFSKTKKENLKKYYRTTRSSHTTLFIRKCNAKNIFERRHDCFGGLSKYWYMW